MVLLCSSFSKTLSRGYRVGWTAPGKYKSRVEWLIHESTFASSTLMRLGIAEYLATSNYQKHLLTLRGHCASQVQKISMIVSKYFPKGTRLTRPEGGFILWVEFPEKLDLFALHRLALVHKISITPGPVFSAQQQYQNCIRLSCGYPVTPDLEHAVAKLGKLAIQTMENGSKTENPR
jgi:DNA-binding transcriptional MocR family regulator